jgi:hypothetical protein
MFIIPSIKHATLTPKPSPNHYCPDPAKIVLCALVENSLPIFASQILIPFPLDPPVAIIFALGE